MTKVRYSLMGAAYAGFETSLHPVEHIKQLGIRYEKAEPQPIAEQWMLYGVEEDSIPKGLPEWIEVIQEKKDVPE